MQPAERGWTGVGDRPRWKASVRSAICTKGNRGAPAEAIALRDPHGTVVHSDRSAQFRSASYHLLLRDRGLTGSMGRVGACGDNAAMESFFSLMQKNILDTRRWRIREEIRLGIVFRIETKHHRKHRQRALDKLIPGRA